MTEIAEKQSRKQKKRDEKKRRTALIATDNADDNDDATDALSMVVLEIFIKHAATMNTAFVGRSILLLSMCNKPHRALIQTEYHFIKLFYSFLGTVEYEGNNVCTMFFYIPKRVDDWSFQFHMPWKYVDTTMNFVFTCRNRQIASFYHVHSHCIINSCVKHLFGVPSALTSTWEEYSDTEGDSIQFSFTRCPRVSFLRME